MPTPSLSAMARQETPESRRAVTVNSLTKVRGLPRRLPFARALRKPALTTPEQQATSALSTPWGNDFNRQKTFLLDIPTQPVVSLHSVTHLNVYSHFCADNLAERPCPQKAALNSGSFAGLSVSRSANERAKEAPV